MATDASETWAREWRDWNQYRPALWTTEVGINRVKWMPQWKGKMRGGLFQIACIWRVSTPRYKTLLKIIQLIAFNEAIAIVAKGRNEPSLDGGARFGRDATDGLLRFEVIRFAIDGHVADTTDELLACPEPTAFLGRVRVSSDVERIVGVGGRDAGHADAGLHEDVVHGQGHHILGFDGWMAIDNNRISSSMMDGVSGRKFTLDGMPFSVAHGVLVLRNVGGDDGAAPVVHAENHRPVDHLQEEVITTTVNRHQNAGRAARFDLEADVDVETDAEVFHCVSKNNNNEKKKKKKRFIKLRPFIIIKFMKPSWVLCAYRPWCVRLEERRRIRFQLSASMAQCLPGNPDFRPGANPRGSFSNIRSDHRQRPECQFPLIFSRLSAPVSTTMLGGFQNIIS